jgi:Protein of unknown function (DUF3574)
MASTYQLFMGRNIPNSDDIVTDDGWFKFLRIVDTIVEGYTWYEANGVWEGEHEDCFVMTVSCTEDQAQDIAHTYKTAFSQLAVGMITLPAMEFI